MLIVAIAAGSWKGSAAEQVHANLSPEDKAKVQDFGKTVFEAGCKSYEDYLQKEGKLNAAGVVNKLRQLWKTPDLHLRKSGVKHFYIST